VTPLGFRLIGQLICAAVHMNVSGKGINILQRRGKHESIGHLSFTRIIYINSVSLSVTGVLGGGGGRGR